MHTDAHSSVTHGPWMASRDNILINKLTHLLIAIQLQYNRANAIHMDLISAHFERVISTQSMPSLINQSTCDSFAQFDRQ